MQEEWKPETFDSMQEKYLTNKIPWTVFSIWCAGQGLRVDKYGKVLPDKEGSNVGSESAKEIYKKSRNGGDPIHGGPANENKTTRKILGDEGYKKVFGDE